MNKRSSNSILEKSDYVQEFEKFSTVVSKKANVNEKTNDKEGNNNEDIITKNPFHFFKKKDFILLIPALIFNGLCATTDVASTIMINKLFSLLTSFQAGETEFMEKVKLPAFGLILIGFGSTIFGWLETSFFTYLGEKQQIRCRKKLFQSLLSRNLDWFEKNSNLNGDLIQLNRSVEEFRASISEYLSVLFKSIFSIIALIIISMVYSWKLTLLVFAIIPIIILTIMCFGKHVDKWAKSEDDYTANAIALLDWNFSSFLWVKIIYSRDLELEKFNKIMDQCEYSFRNFSIFANIVSSIMKTISLMLFVQSFWFGSYLVRKNKDTGSDIISSFYSCLKLAMTISSLSVIAVVFQKANTSFKKVTKFLLSDEDIKNFNTTLLIPETDLYGDIQLNDIYFEYDLKNGNEHTAVLQDVSLHIEPFKTTYLIGKSGSGKSTIANLLLKLYTPSHGHITIDGYDLNKIDSFWLRDQITLIQQFPKLFNDTLENNILLGTPYTSINSADVIEAVRYFNLLEVIDNLPQGYQTYVGKTDDKENNLIQLSGGQEQRLNLVKAKLRNSNILILDESISALDIQQRELFMQKIYEWRKNKTTIIITHELSHIKDDDMVYFIENGKIIESGIKHQLVDLAGKFSNLENQGKNSKKNKLYNKIKRRSMFSNLDDEDLEAQIFITEMDNTKQTNVEKIDEPLSNIRTPIYIAYKLLLQNISTNYKLFYLLGLFIVLCNAILTPVFSYCFSRLITGIIPQNDGTLIQTKEQIKWSMIATSIAIATGITSFISSTILEFTAERLCKNLQNLTLSKILKQDVQFFEYLNTNEIATLLVNDIRDFRMIFSSNLSRLLSGISISLVCIIWTLILGWKYALVGFSMFPLFAIFSFIGTAIMQKTEFAYKDSLNEAESIIYETRNGIKTIICSNLQKHFQTKFSEKLSKVLSCGLKRGISMGFSINIIYLLASIAQAIMLYYGFKLVSNGEYTLVKMMQIVMMILMSVTFLSELMSSAPGLYRGLRVALKLNKLIFELKEEGDDNEIKQNGYLTPNLKKNQTDDCIEFNNVTFEYPSALNFKVLKNLSMNIPKNQIVSIVGESGCGKSTIFSLILRLYTLKKPNNVIVYPSTQQINIDGYDINSIKLSHLMSNIAVVTQKHYFINGSIRENLLYGNPERHSIDDSTIRFMLAKLDLLSIINNDEGLDSILSVNGNLMVSGGQAQRLSIIRALLRPASILLLDEFTASLDVETTELVLNVLKQQCQFKSIICITHQEKIMKNSDKVFVIQDGKVAESGSFDDLMNNKESSLFKMVCDHICN
jgi:ATP-binding cassette subfamily B (MDR/TAP) protein 1